MDKYNLVKGCPKCGCQSTLDRYVEDHVSGSKIRRKCTRCHYLWWNAPLDAKEEKIPLPNNRVTQGAKRPHAMKFDINWHQNYNKNHSKSINSDLNRIKNAIIYLYRSAANCMFTNIQIESAIKNNKDDFDPDKYLKNARQEFMEKTEQRLTAAVTAFEKEFMQSYQTPHGAA